MGFPSLLPHHSSPCAGRYQSETNHLFHLQTCKPDAKYVGQTIRAIDNRCQEHKRASEKGNWSHSGISQHKENCDAEVDWENPSILATFSNKNKKRLTYDLKVREALEIKRQNCGPGRGLNEDFGAYVKTTQWNPVFHSMG